MKQITECTDHELGFIAYTNLKRIEALKNENSLIDQELIKRQNTEQKAPEQEAKA